MIENKDEFNRLFNSIGFGFPESSEELENFENVHKGYSFKSDVNKIDPKTILDSLGAKKEYISKVDYHKRTVLAAEIVYQLREDVSLGHLKLQKLLYLCQNAMRMSIQTNFLKQALGPYDPVLMRSLDKQFEQRKWFKFQKDDFPKYISLEKAGQHSEWYSKYFKNNITQVNFIIETFRDMKTSEVELVATIFACWQEIQNSNLELTNELLVEHVYKWSKEKEKFSQESILKTMNWMKEKGFYPK